MESNARVGFAGLGAQAKLAAADLNPNVDDKEAQRAAEALAVHQVPGDIGWPRNRATRPCRPGCVVCRARAQTGGFTCDQGCVASGALSPSWLGGAQARTSKLLHLMRERVLSIKGNHGFTECAKLCRKFDMDDR